VSGRPPLNLAERPFRNERLPGLVFGLAMLGLFGLTARHAVLVAHLLPGRTAARHTEIASLEREATELRQQAADLRRPDPDKRTLARWLALKDLVDRRVFAWTTLLGRLEATLPTGVRLVAIAPAWEREGVRLDLRAVARRPEAGFEFMKALEERPEFADVLPRSKEPRETEVEFSYTMRYLPHAVHELAEASPGAPAAAPEEEEP
jgi:Tfp pilus assembly protein PilN